MLGLALKVLGWFLSWAFPAKDERDTERAAGENLGQQEAENTNARAGIQEVQKAVDARDADRAALQSDPDRLRDQSAPGARPYVAKPD
jgi:hypothetical protein